MKQKPVGICSVCGNYSYKNEDAGRPCQAHHHGEACTGEVRDASSESAWEACPACSGKAVEQSVDCPQCAGAGWLPA